MLLQECESAGAAIKTHCDIDSIELSGGDKASHNAPAADQPMRYRVSFEQLGQPLTVECVSLVVATGGLSIPTLGGFNFQWAWSSGYSAGMFA